MFNTVKKNVDILDVAEKLFEQEITPIGTNTYELADKSCPLPNCGHKDSFRIHNNGNNEESFYKCFSCDQGGDVVSLVAISRGLTQVEAARLLIQEYKLKVPSSYTPIQELFTTAAVYYSEGLKTLSKYPELNGMTPLEYQVNTRGHSPETLGALQVGWSDGGLVHHLRALGYEAELIQESGLINKYGGDFLPTKTFIYSHVVNNKISHFTFKDPLKQKSYQLPNKNKLNSHVMYNSDSLKLPGAIILVEGENDLISVVGKGKWDRPAVACIGSISGAQLEWMAASARNRDLITIFDSDAAGDKYRSKVEDLRANFSSLIQIKLKDVKDIDEWIQSGRSLTEALSQEAVAPETPVKPAVIGGIVEKEGAYHRVRFKDGEEVLTKITNFTMKLNNIFVRDGQRQREMIVTKDNGFISDPIIIPSEAKVSAKLFRTLIANAADGSYYGREDDLILLWEYVYATTEERTVYIPEVVGRIESFKGWLFKDFFISDLGVKYEADETGVIWIQGQKYGLKPVTIDASTAHDVDGDYASRDVLSLYDKLSTEESEEFLGDFIRQLSLNLNRSGELLGEALTCVGFCWASVYSNALFSRIGEGFPFLMLWGDRGRGKSTIIGWLISLFGAPEQRMTTVPMMNSGVGWGRKMAYFSSLPTCIDELRGDKLSVELYGRMRGYYNRVSRTIGAKESFATNNQKVRSTLMLGGQDVISDDATKQRCIVVRIPLHGRETVKSYEWIHNRKDMLSSIGYYWIMNSHRLDSKTVVAGAKELASTMQLMGIPARTAINWCIPGYFANMLAQKYFPEFDYIEFMKKASTDDALAMESGNILVRFFEVVEGLQTGERPQVGGDHIMVDGDFIYIWFSEIFRIVNREKKADIEEPFSKHALLSSIRDTAYFVEETRKGMGMNSTLRRVIKLDLTKSPEVLQNISNFSRN